MVAAGCPAAAQRPSAVAARQSSLNFSILCALNAALSIAYYLVLPVVPLAAHAAGASDAEVGLIVGMFAVVTVFVRPFIGRVVDRRGSKVVMAGGLALTGAACLGYVGASTTAPLLAVRSLHGLGQAGWGTGSNVYLMQIVAPERRARMISYFTLSNNIPMILTPALAIPMSQQLGYPPVFALAAALTLAAFVGSFWLTEQREATRQRGSGALLPAEAIFPSLVWFTLGVANTAASAFLPLMAAGRGIGHPGLYFTVMGVTLVATRLLGARFAERFSIRQLLLPSMALVALATLLLALAHSLTAVLVAGALTGLGWGYTYPLLFSYTIERASPRNRGAATATFSAAWDASVGVGATVLGGVIQLAGFTGMFIVAALATVAGAVAFALKGK